MALAHFKTLFAALQEDVDNDEDDDYDGSSDDEDPAPAPTPSPRPNDTNAYTLPDAVNTPSAIDSPNQTPPDLSFPRPYAEPSFGFHFTDEDEQEPYHLVDPSNLRFDKPSVDDALQYYSLPEAFHLLKEGPDREMGAFNAGLVTAAIGSTTAFIVGSIIATPAAGFAAADAVLEPAYALGVEAAELVDDVVSRASAIVSIMADVNLTEPTSGFPSPTPNGTPDIRNSNFQMK
jgi:hypothetical protein